LEAGTEAEEQIVNTLDLEETASDEESDNERLKEWLEEFAQGEETEETDIIEGELEEDLVDLEENSDEIEEEEGEDMDDNVDLELLEALNADEEAEKALENKDKTMPRLRATSVAIDDEVTVISKGTTISGSISSDGSLDIMGTITGDIECLGKLSISGKIIGNSSAAEVYVNTERLEGSITSEGSVKVGLGTVIIGDIVATSGVIAGAVKGEIDVNGPIVIDSTAIIKGNIKAKSVQINNGAVIEGFCSLSYSAVDVDNIFE
jgi:cytoskeletal protein CcmA (bactofilin family)